MGYTVLAVKWRPRRFADLVGQQHVVQALTNSLSMQRLHHAYLFSGTRGVGKTTIARILAKALNCEQGIVAEPCGTCDACRAIDEGRFVDLIEVDAASKTKVDDTRELLDNVQYAPTHGRYKVYLIDEVHMLSNHSFNALLKTLEEPPPHVKFLLATTDPQKLPITVLSRCLQFHLKRLTVVQIGAQIDKVCNAESVPVEPDAVKALAKAADGSVRDALSMLDQAIAYSGGEVSAQLVNDMLGTIDRGHVVRMIEAIAVGDGAALVDELDRLEERAPDYASLIEELMGLLQRIAVIQLVGGGRSPDEELDVLGPLAERLSPEEVQLYYQIALQGRRDLPVARDLRMSTEMTLLRMLAFRPLDEPSETKEPPSRARRPSSAAKESPLRASERSTARESPAGAIEPSAAGVSTPRTGEPPAARVSTSHTSARQPVRQAAASARRRSGGTSAEGTDDPHSWGEDGQSGARSTEPFDAGATEVSAGPPPIPDATPVGGGTDADDYMAKWANWVRASGVQGAARQLADHCELVRVMEGRIQLILASGKETMNTPQLRERLQTAIGEHLGRSISLDIIPGKPSHPTMAQQRRASEDARMRSARESIERDPNVRAAEDVFGAVLEADSIRPVA